ncbi:hypothetical protein OG321_41580 [Streptomyces sp. NBC_00424]|uniref:peptidoglycan-binding domain-containing protein n=1 Tax=Streptomyces sp. NBC_00424 TaxID=2903648 RepID=UPI00225A8376|nr:hypothetical protein [Streptomyces sp. NBC_00424]MCX5077642.1 hypothetical protein [Streptomyces sp. NBC_00424]MCX5078551.1 hypothetical protein [Streptomyces sp. NBC_00424]MCX5078897.1 hypothetical protein [Streptomyces sp. NBC_00424]
MSPTVVPLTDSELCGLLATDPTRQAAAEELMRRHGDVTLAYAEVLSRERQDAEMLAVAALNRMLDIFQHGDVPGAAWFPRLLVELRRLAAERADARRTDALSLQFADWLNLLLRGPQESFASAVAAAEADSPLLRALHRLPGATTTEVLHALAPAAGTSSARPTSRVPASGTRQALLIAYLQVHTARVPERRCRHLAIRIADELGGGHPASPDLTAHVSSCGHCTRALADLRAIHSWDTHALQQGALLWPAVPVRRPASTAQGAGIGGPPPPTGSSTPQPARDQGIGDAVTGTRSHRRERSMRMAPARRRAAVGAAGLGAVALTFGLALAKMPDAQVRDLSAAATPSADLEPTDRPPTPRPPSPIATSTPSRTKAPTPRASDSPAAAGPSPTLAVRPSPPAIAVPPTPSPAGSPTPQILRRGDQGDAVLTLQHLLLRVGCDQIAAQLTWGRFDDATAAVLMSFQRDVRIRGKERTQVLYGPETREALERWASTTKC